jgi:hypothetical protein
MSYTQEYLDDREKFRLLVNNKLKQMDPFAVDAIECLLKDDNDKSAFMIWLSFKGKYNIELSEEENNIVQRWYSRFGR